MAKQKLHGWEFWKSIGSPKFVCAPMVDGSEEPFRMLTRKYGVTLAYTPMFHSRKFSTDPAYRKAQFTMNKADRPLFAQFCANDPELLLAAARFVEDQVDAVDINFGCPQHIAKRGHYGAFLLEEADLICSLVRTLHENLSIPVTAKIRLLPDLDKTIELALRIQEAGASVLTVHGRTKEQKKQLSGLANWDAIKAIRERLDIPVVSNGNIRDLKDVQDCLEHTGCCAVMSAEGLLANPGLFAGDSAPSMLDLTLEYIAFSNKHQCEDNLKGHIFWQLHPTGLLEKHWDLRDKLHTAPTREMLQSLVAELVDREAKGVVPGPKPKHPKKDKQDDDSDPEMDVSLFD